MSNWTNPQKNATNFEVKNGYLNYYHDYSPISAKFAGRLRKGTLLSAKYDITKDALVITKCSKRQSAVGKYILSPTGANGKLLLHIKLNASKTTTEAKTTTDPTTGKTTPENTTESTTTEEDNDETTDTEDTSTDTNTSGSDASVLAGPVYIDDAFLKSVAYKTYATADEYSNNLQNGLRVKDLRGILGMPHQFLPIADPRIDNKIDAGDDGAFGRVYSEKIIKQIPLLLMTPGSPTFLAGYTSEQKNITLNALFGNPTESLDSIFNDGSIGKYYSLKFSYTEYFHYVNAMLRSAAFFLELDTETIDRKELGTYNWLYTTSNITGDVISEDDSEDGVFSHEGLGSFLGPYAGCVAFYADAGTTVDDSFGNSTTESQLASGLNTLSDTGREINFLVGNVGGMAGLSLTELTGQNELDQNIQTIQDKVSGFIGVGNVLSNILGKASTILAGGRLVFPEIWSDSSFSRSYSCSMKLVSPSGDKLSVFLNILVPIYHLLAFTLPREATNQAYFSPFLVRAYYKGLFNVDMGIIPGLTITKGDEGEWTVDGIPTVANVSFEIKDLYDGMYMSKQQLSNQYGIMSNTQELDYIANSCGINVNDQEIARTAKMFAALGFSSITDKITIGIFGEISQYFNQKVQNIFGVF